MVFELGVAAPYVALGLLLAVFMAFVLDWRPPEVTAFCGATLALALGLVSVEDTLAAIANPAPATIAAMFVLSASLVRTGALETVIVGLGALATRRPTVAIIGFFAAATAGSAFVNNTPIVMVLIPVVFGLAQKLGTVPSRMLMPLSFMVILGGTCSLIGTSTNLLVDGITRELGLAPFSLFEIAPLGLIVAVIGGGFLAITAPRLLRAQPFVTSAGQAPREWLAELFIPVGSPFVGRIPGEIEALRRGGGSVIDVVRGDASLRHELATVRLESGDIVVVRTGDVELMGFRDGIARGALVPGLEAARARRSTVVEVLVGPNAKVIGRTLRLLRWRRRFGVYALALYRHGETMSARLEDTRLKVGDTLLVDGAPEDTARLAEEMRLMVLSASPPRAYRRRKAPIAVAILAVVVVLAALEVAAILPLALIGVAVALVTGCIDADEGIGAMDGRLLLLIVSMLVLGTAMERSGALALIVEWLMPVLANGSPLLALALIYVLTSVLTELVTNNAVAVLMTPIAMAIATSLGLDPRPFVVAVMFAASASFATPIGYQTNTLVYNAGNYRFVDFLRLGLPMNVVVGTVTILFIPVFWPLSVG
jgi:di/tricarboxylate transporter